MRNLALALVASLGLFACGGAAMSSSEEAKSANDTNVWADFKGTYSQPSDAPRAKNDLAPAKKEAAPKAEEPTAAKAKQAPVETEEEKPLFTAPKKDPSKGTVKGESVSSVSVDQLSTAVAAAAKGKVVSSGTVTGARYEVITVETKKATIKIIRPAATPNAKGPEVAAPTNKLGDIAKNESAWFDDQGDVIVVVSAAKKATAAKVLNAVVKH